MDDPNEEIAALKARLEMMKQAAAVNLEASQAWRLRAQDAEAKLTVLTGVGDEPAKRVIADDILRGIARRPTPQSLLDPLEEPWRRSLWQLLANTV